MYDMYRTWGENMSYMNKEEFDMWKAMPESHYVDYLKENPDDAAALPEPYTLASILRSLPPGYYEDYEKTIYRHVEVCRVLSFADSLFRNYLTDEECFALDYLYGVFRCSERELNRNLGL